MISKGIRKRTKEHNEAISLALRNLYKNRGGGPLSGKKFSAEHKRKISIRQTGANNSMFGRVLSLHPNWKGGLTSQPYPVEWTKVLRESIRVRDKHACQICGGSDCRRRLQVHHIDYNKNNCNPDNLITLCIPCHIRTNYRRDHWVAFFASHN